MNAIVTKTFMLCYGIKNKAWISLHRGQKWELLIKPNPEKFPWYTIKRKGIALDVMPEDFKEFFEVDE